MIESWSVITAEALQQLWVGFINFIPAFLGALIIFLVGLVVAVGFGELVERLIDLLKIDKALEKLGFKKFTDRANIKLDSGYFVGAIVKWLLILVFLKVATDILGLAAVSDFLMKVINFIPSLVVAVLVVLISVLVGDFLAKLVTASVAGAGLRAAKFLGSLTEWSLVIFGLLIALVQLGIGREILLTLFTGIVAMIAIAGGLAFGLGGKELASQVLGKLKEKVED